MKKLPWIEILFSNAIAIVALVVSIVYSSPQAQGTWLKISFPLFFVSLAFVTFAVVRIIQDSKRKMKFFGNRSALPGRLQIKGLLKFIAKNRLNLTVIGRTNVSWFGDIDFDDPYDEKISLYKKAVDSGCSIHFVIQHAFVKNPNIDSDIADAIQKDYKLVVEKFRELAGKFNNTNIRLSFTDEPIENSMTMAHRNDGYVKLFLYDISQNIKEKPSILFKDDSVFNEFREKFRNIEQNAMGLREFLGKRDKADSRVKELIHSYGIHSTQRQNSNEKLAYHYFRRKSSANTPPVSIQLLITNSCSSCCIMCDHHKINSTDELSTEEIKNILFYICDMGTKNVIISGGEPLNNRDWADILRYGKGLGLNLGLLTNGIGRGGRSITPEDARIIKETCDWVQLSIDSFDPAIYRLIRNRDYHIVDESLKNLQNANANVEVCYTIQKLNADEAIRIIDDSFGPQTYGAPVRFKFAHGPDDGNVFLAPKEKVELFLKKCSSSGDRHNAPYFNKMFRQQYFTPEGIASGAPLKKKNEFFERDGNRCHIINYSCKIDAVGDVYPCCYLFDDNQGGDSKIRNVHKLGSLRRMDKVWGHDEMGHNLLSEILFTQKRLESYRQSKIPIHREACDNCTRHFYQNEFLNELDRIASEYDDIKYAYAQQIDDHSKLWL